jgi:5-carboxymethyl-2-hydroxymuconate isomerase
MPHLSIEYSKNLKSKLSVDEILKQLHASVGKCADIEMNRVKSRLIEHERVISYEPANEIEMIHATLSILSGREPALRQSYGQILFEALLRAVPESLQKSISLTVEIREMERESYFRN